MKRYVAAGFVLTVLGLIVAAFAHSWPMFLAGLTLAGAGSAVRWRAESRQP